MTDHTDNNNFFFGEIIGAPLVQDSGEKRNLTFKEILLLLELATEGMTVYQLSRTGKFKSEANIYKMLSKIYDKYFIPKNSGEHRKDRLLAAIKSDSAVFKENLLADYQKEKLKDRVVKEVGENLSDLVKDNLCSSSQLPYADWQNLQQDIRNFTSSSILDIYEKRDITLTISELQEMTQCCIDSLSSSCNYDSSSSSNDIHYQRIVAKITQVQEEDDGKITN
ncbi:hypothetical protein I4641_21070 [Waterburya agarophytonicola K14]|uniref:Uncharacterized protein n=1 Tax=Waterburya agarophytonicola KI4 TaxID=2874699 RepID=A0A964FGY7_9CYAN|nr:hypothetical protein [Waterburya agarophytonicola]MCC0179455.1 hypothetical protein [Waterburya agarophytonicola KI4]